MKKLIYLAAVLALLIGGLAAAATGAQAKEPKILEFDTMVGVPRPYTGATNAIRGVPGGGLPWVIGSAQGELKQSGKLEVTVQGLVFDPDDPTVIANGLANRNTVGLFKAVVSCQTLAAGNAAVMNVSTAAFPATLGLASEGGGNAKIEAQLSLPTPCIAPIVFVTNPNGAWFAATGF